MFFASITPKHLYIGEIT